MRCSTKNTKITKIGNENKYLNNQISNAYVNFAGCILEHILSTKNLTNNEKNYFILANTLSILNLHGNKKRATALSAVSWAKKLHCSKSQIFTMQKQLQDKGYFIIEKYKNSSGQNNRNTIYTTLPTNVFTKLLLSEDKNNISIYKNTSSVTEFNKIEILESKKLFISIKYQFLKDIMSDANISSVQRLVLLYLYFISYKIHTKNLINCNTCIINFTMLENILGCNKSYVSKSLKQLEILGYIKKQKFYTKKETKLESRQDKSSWVINLLMYNTNVNQKNISCNDPEVYKFHHNNIKDIKEDINNVNIKKNLSFQNLIVKKYIKNIPKEKLLKILKFAFKLKAQFLSKISIKQIIIQLIIHITHWKPSKIQSILFIEQIDIALSVAWRLFIQGNWKIPKFLNKINLINIKYFNKFNNLYYSYFKNLLTTIYHTQDINTLNTVITKLYKNIVCNNKDKYKKFLYYSHTQNDFTENLYKLKNKQKFDVIYENNKVSNLISMLVKKVSVY